MPISKNWQKRLRQLQQKKQRQDTGLFFVEGAKNVLEGLHAGLACEMLFATPDFLAELSAPPPHCEEASPEALARAGTFRSNDAALAVFHQPQKTALRKTPSLRLGLEALRDPGNLGTILRIADWYGIEEVLCSPDCVDVFNPKVIAASMGAYARVQVHYETLPALLPTLQQPLWATTLGGENLHTLSPPSIPPLLLIGNEAQGLSTDLQQLADCLVTIPRWGGAESLNAAVATAVLCDNLRRQL